MGACQSVAAIVRPDNRKPEYSGTMASYTTYQERELLSLLQNGDHQAFTEIYNRYWDRILYIAAVKCDNLATAEEAVQDVFMDLWERRAALTINHSLEAYLAVSVKYRIINVLAKRRREKEYIARGEASLPLADNSTEEWLQYEELRRKLDRSIEKLPEKCRLTYLLRRAEGLSQKEVAGKLQISEKAVEANFARALKALRATLRHFLFSCLCLFFF